MRIIWSLVSLYPLYHLDTFLKLEGNTGTDSVSSDYPSSSTASETSEPTDPLPPTDPPPAPAPDATRPPAPSFSLPQLPILPFPQPTSGPDIPFVLPDFSPCPEVPGMWLCYVNYAQTLGEKASPA